MSSKKKIINSYKEEFDRIRQMLPEDEKDWPDPIKLYPKKSQHNNKLRPFFIAFEAKLDSPDNPELKEYIRNTTLFKDLSAQEDRAKAEEIVFGN